MIQNVPVLASSDRLGALIMLGVVIGFLLYRAWLNHRQRRRWRRMRELAKEIRRETLD